MVNYRLQGAMLDAGVSSAALAAAVEVDVKSVTRWIREDRVPYPTHRVKVAHLLRQTETFLWPSLSLMTDDSGRGVRELQRVWPTRSAVSSESWHELFSRTKVQLDILVYAGGFLLETLDLLDVLRVKGANGASVRMLVGDPSCEAVRLRAQEISVPWLPARCATTADYLRAMRDEPGVSVRPHVTTLYASLFRFDDLIVVNTHAFGVWAAASPVLQLHREMDRGLFDFYASAFERVWTSAGDGEPVRPEV